MYLIIHPHGVRYFPKDIFPRAIFQVTNSQVATSQMCNFPSGNFPKVRLAPLMRRRIKWPGRVLRLGWVRGWVLRVKKLPLRKLHINGKLALGKNSLGIYPTSWSEWGIYLYTYFACLFLFLFKTKKNVKTAEPIRPTFCVSPHMTPGKVWLIKISKKYFLKLWLKHVLFRRL